MCDGNSDQSGSAGTAKTPPPDSGKQKMDTSPIPSPQLPSPSSMVVPQFQQSQMSQNPMPIGQIGGNSQMPQNLLLQKYLQQQNVNKGAI